MPPESLFPFSASSNPERTIEQLGFTLDQFETPLAAILESEQAQRDVLQFGRGQSRMSELPVALGSSEQSICKLFALQNPTDPAERMYVQIRHYRFRGFKPYGLISMSRIRIPDKYGDQVSLGVGIKNNGDTPPTAYSIYDRLNLDVKDPAEARRTMHEFSEIIPNWELTPLTILEHDANFQTALTNLKAEGWLQNGDLGETGQN